MDTLKKLLVYLRHKLFTLGGLDRESRRLHAYGCVGCLY